ncbi:MAG: exo-alpha-sialidase [Clostridiales bacterium]|nr:exo-alpha-sialidase [Clostridiales bacterium]
MWYLEKMKELLSPQDEQLLKEIYAPQIVAVQPEDSRRSICVMPDGELRVYGHENQTQPYRHSSGRPVYISSRDCGLSWKKHLIEGGGVLGAAVRNPRTGGYLTIKTHDYNRGEKGTWAFLSDIGSDDREPKAVKVSDLPYQDVFQPKPMKRPGSWMVSMSRPDNGWNIPAFARSDDDGLTWRVTELKSTPKHEPVWPHVDVRWQNTGAEPIVTELEDGTLVMLARNSTDFFYIYRSHDGGESWTDGEPSRFRGTLTTPYFLELSDGRTILFWNNTQPLPETRHTNVWPPLDSGTVAGLGEDVFTNRDAAHAAITSDFKNWQGFREIALNGIRNEPDFRVRGGWQSSADKSVHQFQALELPFGKVLVAYGQNVSARRMAIFDIGWLYESSRTEDWQQGLINLSTHMFVKSIYGSHLGTGYGGHCAANRTDGALLIPDPDATFGEVLQICRITDPRLLCEKQGAAWNFPAAHKGSLRLRVRIEGAGLHVSLLDRWMNPTDITARLLSPMTFDLTSDTLSTGVWHDVEIIWDTGGMTRVLSDGEPLFGVRCSYRPENGISYLHLQTMAEGYDPKGTLVGRMEMKAIG